MTEERIKNKILHRLGDKLVQVELDSEDWDEIFDDSYRWWNARKGITKKYVLSLSPDVTEYQMPLDCKGLVEYIPPSESDDSITSDAIDPFDVTTNIANATLGQHKPIDYVLTDIYHDMLKSVYNGESSTWLDFSSVDSTSGPTLVVSPSPSESKVAVVYYNSSVFGQEQVNYLYPIDLEIFLEVVECHAKIVVGRKRSKFSDYQIPGGIVTLDGVALIDDANEKLEKLHERIMDSQSPTPFITG